MGRCTLSALVESGEHALNAGEGVAGRRSATSASSSSTWRARVGAPGAARSIRASYSRHIASAWSTNSATVSWLLWLPFPHATDPSMATMTDTDVRSRVGGALIGARRVLVAPLRWRRASDCECASESTILARFFARALLLSASRDRPLVGTDSQPATAGDATAPADHTTGNSRCSSRLTWDLPVEHSARTARQELWLAGVRG